MSPPTLRWVSFCGRVSQFSYRSCRMHKRFLQKKVHDVLFWTKRHNCVFQSVFCIGRNHSSRSGDAFCFVVAILVTLVAKHQSHCSSKNEECLKRHRDHFRGGGLRGNHRSLGMEGETEGGDFTRFNRPELYRCYQCETNWPITCAISGTD